MLKTIARTLCAGALATLAAPALTADDIQLPPTMAWTAYGVNSSGYAHCVAMGKALKSNFGINLRVLPGDNDVSRLLPLREGKVQAAANGVGTYFAQEGVFGFDKPSWGPQATRVVLSSKGKANLMIGVAGDIEVKTLADLKGKRVAWVKSAPALNHNVTAFLTFAGLTWDDVEKVEFSGFGASWDGILNDQADAAWTITTSGKPKQVAASPRGLVWPPTPFDDTEAWERMLAIAPYMTQNVGTVGSNLSAEQPVEGQAYPYPILTVYADADADFVYNLTKALVETFDEYKDGAPGAAGWALANQTLEWAAPYHDGTIRYLQESGVWTEQHQAHNDRLLERQQVLQNAWAAYTQGADTEDEAAFSAGWLESRREALQAAGFKPVF